MINTELCIVNVFPMPVHTMDIIPRDCSYLGKKHVLSLVGMTSFYSELNKGLGASTKIWELTDRVPVIPLTGKSSTTVTNPSTTKLYFNKFNLYYINMLC